MNLELVTLRGRKLDQRIYQVTIPTQNGPIAVFPSHESLVTIAIPGALTVRNQKDDSDERLDYYAISGGVVEISDDRVRILVDEAEHSDDIVEADNKAALDRAMELRRTAKNQVELEKATELIDRHAVRLQVAGLRRRRSR